jgi:hypothetical protein
MVRALVISMLLASAAIAEENSATKLVISPIAGASTAGIFTGLYREEGRLRYGVSAVATGGRNRFDGASLDARWTFLESGVTPYVGAGMGAFSFIRGADDQGVQPALSFEGGLELGRFFAGGRVLLPVSTRTAGIAAHDSPGFGTASLLAQLGFAL